MKYRTFLVCEDKILQLICPADSDDDEDHFRLGKEDVQMIEQDLVTVDIGGEIEIQDCF